jgi:hypothetical protein
VFDLNFDDEEINEPTYDKNYQEFDEDGMEIHAVPDGAVKPKKIRKRPPKKEGVRVIEADGTEAETSNFLRKPKKLNTVFEIESSPERATKGPKNGSDSDSDSSDDMPIEQPIRKSSLKYTNPPQTTQKIEQI